MASQMLLQSVEDSQDPRDEHQNFPTTMQTIQSTSYPHVDVELVTPSVNKSAEPSIVNTNERDLDESNSLQLAKILVSACLALILLHRGLVEGNEECLGEHALADLLTDEGVISYENISNARDSGLGSGAETLLVLRKGVFRKVDDLIDLMEAGVFPALAQHALKALEVCIIPRKDQQNQMVESYRFQVQYPTIDSNNFGSIQKRRTLDAYQSFVIFMSALRTGLALSRVKLPAKRYLSLNLTLFDRVDFDVPGFVKSFKRGNSIVQWPTKDAHSRAWEMKARQLPPHESPYHRVHLFLMMPRPERGRESEKMATLQVPADFFWSAKRDLQHDFEPKKVPKKITKIVFVDSRKLKFDASSPDTIPSTSTSSSQDIINANYLSTQTRQDVYLKNSISAMQISSSACKDLTPTQPQLFHDPTNDNVYSLADSKAMKSLQSHHRRPRHICPTKVAELHYQVVNSQEQQTPQDSIRCECGDDTNSSLDGNDLMQCLYCGHSQHKFCYGYFDLEPFRQTPEKHSCYNCLLLPLQEGINDKMPGLVKYRLALAYLYWFTSGSAQYQNATGEVRDVDLDNMGLAARLKGFMHELDSTFVEEVLCSLTEAGYLERSSRVFRVVVDEIDNGMLHIIDPMAYIVEHYEAQKDGEPRGVSKGRLDRESAAFNVYKNKIGPGGPYCMTVTNTWGESTQRYGYYPDAAEEKGNRKRSHSTMTSSTPAAPSPTPVPSVPGSLQAQNPVNLSTIAVVRTATPTWKDPVNKILASAIGSPVQKSYSAMSDEDDAIWEEYA